VQRVRALGNPAELSDTELLDALDEARCNRPEFRADPERHLKAWQTINTLTRELEHRNPVH